MKLAILIPWNKTLGYDNDEDLNVLEKKAMVIAKYPNEDDSSDIYSFHNARSLSFLMTRYTHIFSD